MSELRSFSCWVLWSIFRWPEILVRNGKSHDYCLSSISGICFPSSPKKWTCHPWEWRSILEGYHGLVTKLQCGTERTHAHIFLPWVLLQPSVLQSAFSSFNFSVHKKLMTRVMALIACSDSITLASILCHSAHQVKLRLYFFSQQWIGLHWCRHLQVFPTKASASWCCLWSYLFSCSLSVHWA